MMADLDISEGEYWRIRDKLLDGGVIALGKGKGGSVALVPADVAPSSPEESDEPSNDPGIPVPSAQQVEYAKETALYQPCLQVLESQWKSMHRLFSFKAEITALQGSRKTGGIWTRPDIAALSVRTFPYWPGKHYDLWTFEIKPRSELNVLGLYEALAHARWATHSWALYHVDTETAQDAENLDRMTAEAQRLGVGFITFLDPAEFSTWDIRVYSTRSSPDVALHDEFVKVQLSEATRELFLQWAR